MATMLPRQNTTDDTVRRYVCGGFLFISKRGWYSDPEDYLDWYGKSWTFGELTNDLRNGVLPLGMVVNVQDYPPMVVTASQCYKVWNMTPITDLYATLAFASNPILARQELESTTHGGDNV